MRWYGWLFLFALLLFIGSRYNWFGLLKTDLDKSNDKFKEFNDFIGEFIPIVDKMSPEEQNEYVKKALIKYEEYSNIITKLNKPDIIQHAKYMTYFIIEEYKKMAKLFDISKNLARTDLETAKKMTNDINRFGSLSRNYTLAIVQIINDNPDLEKELSDIAKPTDELERSLLKAFS